MAAISHRATTLVLAAAVLLSVLAPLATRVEAQTTSSDLQIATYPFFATRPLKEGSTTATEHMVAMNKTTGVQTRVIEISNPKPVVTTNANDINKVIFTSVLSADPGTPTSPGISHAFTWDQTAAQANNLDWTVVADNAATTAGGTRTLTFSGGSLEPGGTARFTIAVKMDADAVGNSPNPANQESFPIAVQSQTIAGDTMTTSPAATSFRIYVDNRAPTLLGATTRDANFDGKLDRIQLDFSEAVDPNTFFRQDFIVRDTSVSPAYDYVVSQIEAPKVGRVAFTNTGVFTLLHQGGPTGAQTAMPSSPTPLDGEKVAFLVLTPRGPYDTGVVPQLYYDSPTASRANFNITDLAGNHLAVRYENDTSVSEIDGAKPVFVAATAVSGANTVNLVFSEDVRGTGAATQTTTLNQIVVGDIEHFDGASTPNNFHDLSEIAAVEHTDGAGAGRIAKLKLTSPTPGTLASGDVCPFPGATCDKIGLTVKTSPPANCPTPDFAPCNIRINDRSGGHLTAVTLGGGATPLSILAPHVALKAQVNNDANKVTLDFTVPVSDGSGDGSVVKIDAFDVVAADGSGQGPAGVVLAQQVDGKQVILTLDKKTRPTDLDDTPARIRIRCEKIKVTGLDNTFIPCADPDNDGRPDIDMEDRTRPAIREVQTVDGNRDGYLDALFLIMNEPVDDSSFCLSMLPNPNAPPAKTFQIPAVCDPGTNPDVALTIDSICGPYTWETNVEGVVEESLAGLDIAKDPDNQKNDRFGLIKFPQANNGAGCPGPQPTDFIPGLRTRGEGLFADLSQFTPVNNVRKMVPICQGKSDPTSDCPKWTNSVASDGECPTGAPSTCPEDPPELDRAPPVILSAKTVDDFPKTAKEGNGLIDGYKLHFSEPVDDKSFRAADWKVNGHTVALLRTAPLAIDLTERAPASLCGLTQSYKNDCEIIVVFTESNATVAPDGDTDATPQITYKHAGGVGGMRDLDGVDMRPVETTTIDESDGSRPVIFRAEAQVGKAKTRVVWSEPVDNGARGGLVRNDLTYSNVNQKDVVGMADQDAVQSIASDRYTYVTMTQTMSSDDINKDCIAADLNAVYEVSPRLPIALKQVASVTCHGFVTASDIEPPARIVNLTVVPGLVTANSITLSFVAPGDDGADFGSVTDYQVRVSKQTITPERFSNTTGSTADAVLRTNGINTPLDFDDYTLVTNPAVLGAHGTIQQLTVIGLAPQTKFFFAVRAFDDAGQASFPSDPVFATTGVDTTPPLAPVPAATVVRGGVTANRTVTFSWDAVLDPDSTVTYVYRLDKNPEGSLGETDLDIPSTSVVFANLNSGEYVFHLAAKSAGGVSQVAHYPFTIGFAKVSAADLQLANERLRQRSTFERDGDVNIIHWTLPPQELLPTGAALEGIRIMRLDGTTIKEVHLAKGSYNNLASGSYTDPAGNKTSAYRVEFVFAEGQTQPSTSLSPQFTKVKDVSPNPFPLGIVLSIVAALLVIGLVVGVVLYLRRAKAPATTPPAGTDATSGLPTHDVECPNCKTPFQAVGALPLQIHCPKCGVTGVLQ